VVSTAADAGLIEVVEDAVSLAHLREKWADMKWPPAEQTLHSYFVKAYGEHRPCLELCCALALAKGPDSVSAALHLCLR
jgi:hypothetical protein